MKTLYVTDLDGTLLNSKDGISAKSIEGINRLIENGMLFTYATARSLVSSSVVTRGLKVKAPVIVYNGALILHPETKEVLHSLSFTIEEMSFAKEEMRRQGIDPIVYAYVDSVERVSWNVNKENDGIRRYILNRQVDPRLRPLEDNGRLFEGEIFYYTCIGTREELLPVYERFASDPRFRCTLQQELYREEFWCEIMPAKATKAEAIRKLKELYECDRVVSFGDAINDIPMFEISDECYAVENAVPELKAIATDVIKSNDEDGVADWLMQRRFFS